MYLLGLFVISLIYYVNQCSLPFSNIKYLDTEDTEDTGT